MGAPTITFATGSSGAWGALPTTYDFGTLATGSSGSVQTWMIFNNLLTGSTISDAQNVTIGLHDEGDTLYVTQSSMVPASGSAFPQNWIYIQGVSYYFWNGTNTGSGIGVADANFTGVYSGSSGVTLSKNQGSQTISGSAILGGTTGSAWQIKVYAAVPSGVAQGQKSGSLFIKYQYV